MHIEIKILNKEFYKHKDKCSFSGISYDLPHYATQGSAGIDLVCTDDAIVPPGAVRPVFTGLAIHIGSDSLSSGDFRYAGLIMPRSGLGTRGLVLANTLGLLDEDFQGEILLQVLNRNPIGSENMIVPAGGRIAQLVIVPVIKAQWHIVNDFSGTTERHVGGFGSTGF